uniref:Hypothetical chloroplast RF1 n=1 Tax=Haematococcus lacustris TaxID=44745 RepID=A0A2K9YRQ9_HAELA|nr:hypothetical chloroplast RF1 [Haematococcus lacustris]AUW36437.1 hypothetical chloroplast RF1 [Haematococcus lacustris]
MSNILIRKENSIGKRLRKEFKNLNKKKVGNNKFLNVFSTIPLDPTFSTVAERFRPTSGLSSVTVPSTAIEKLQIGVATLNTKTSPGSFAEDPPLGPARSPFYSTPSLRQRSSLTSRRPFQEKADSGKRADGRDSGKQRARGRGTNSEVAGVNEYSQGRNEKPATSRDLTIPEQPFGLMQPSESIERQKKSSIVLRKKSGEEPTPRILSLVTKNKKIGILMQNESFFSNNYGLKRKRNRRTRSMLRRNRGVYKKRTLTEYLKKDVNTFYKVERLLKTYQNRLFKSFSSSYRAVGKATLDSLKSTALDELPLAVYSNAKPGIRTGVSKKFYEKININLYKENTFVKNSETFTYKTSKKKENGRFVATALKLFRRTPSGLASELKKKDIRDWFQKSLPFGPLKQRTSKQRKQRFWKQKRSKYSQKRRKYRKKRRYIFGKLRLLSKQYKRNKISNWWLSNTYKGTPFSFDASDRRNKQKSIDAFGQRFAPPSIDAFGQLAPTPYLGFGAAMLREPGLAFRARLLMVKFISSRPPRLSPTGRSSLLVPFSPGTFSGLHRNGRGPTRQDTKTLRTRIKGKYALTEGIYAKLVPLRKATPNGEGGERGKGTAKPWGSERNSPNSIPSMQTSTAALWQIEKDQLIQQKLNNLNTLDSKDKETYIQNSMQFIEKDFWKQPLLHILSLENTTVNTGNNIETNPINRINMVTSSLLTQPFIDKNTVSPSMASFGGLVGRPSASLAGRREANEPPANEGSIPNIQSSIVKVTSGFAATTVKQLYENLFNKKDITVNNNNLLSPNTTLPFYAGWDENLRKFVVTNRMLSRIEAGFVDNSPNNNFSNLIQNSRFLSTAGTLGKTHKNEYSAAPVQGLNAATTIYWQIPFTTYDPDQFFVLGMDGFSPIGWRKFLFRHSLLKTWLTTLPTPGRPLQSSVPTGPYESRGIESNLQGKGGDIGESLVSNEGLTRGIIEESARLKEVASKTNLVQTIQHQKQRMNTLYKTEKMYNLKNTTRRLKKRYRRVKKHPRTPVWYPSGPLLNQVLPVHYIYVFYKRSRLPRERYIKRRLLNKETITKNEGLNKLRINNPAVLIPAIDMDFTLRKRLKPKRKYLLKRDSSKVVLPQRLKFLGKGNTNIDTVDLENLTKPLSVFDTKEKDSTAAIVSFKMRPSNKPIIDVVKEQNFLRFLRDSRKQQRKAEKAALLRNTTNATNNMEGQPRIKQLRQKIQRQVIRTVWRYRPRAGGFVWPGDYLKLENVKIPQLNSDSGTKDSLNTNTKNPESVGKTNIPKVDTFPNTPVLSIESTSTTVPTFSAKQPRGTANLLESALSKDPVGDKGQISKVKGSNKQRKKKKALVEWQIQPKLYLLEKHNLKVLKKKYEKSLRSYKEK